MNKHADEQMSKTNSTTFSLSVPEVSVHRCVVADLRCQVIADLQLLRSIENLKALSVKGKPMTMQAYVLCSISGRC